MTIDELINRLTQDTGTGGGKVLVVVEGTTHNVAGLSLKDNGDVVLKLRISRSRKHNPHIERMTPAQVQAAKVEK